MHQFVDAKKLAAALDVKLPTIRKWVRSTDIPHLRIGRLVRFRLDDVITWLRNRGHSASQSN
jgi:excisionase family DNA binding protein